MVMLVEMRQGGMWKRKWSGGATGGESGTAGTFRGTMMVAARLVPSVSRSLQRSPEFSPAVGWAGGLVRVDYFQLRNRRSLLPLDPGRRRAGMRRPRTRL